MRSGRAVLLLAGLAIASLAGCTLNQIVRPSIVVTVVAPQSGILGPLEGAEVLLSDGVHGGRTGSDGKFAMYGVRTGHYNLTVDESAQKNVQSIWVGNETLELTVRLNETAIPDLLVLVLRAPTNLSIRAPLPDVSVLLSDNVHGGRTNAYGAYGFFDLPRGIYNVTAVWGRHVLVRQTQIGSETVTLEMQFTDIAP